MTAARRPYVHVRPRSPIVLRRAHRRLVVAAAVLLEGPVLLAAVELLAA